MKIPSLVESFFAGDAILRLARVVYRGEWSFVGTMLREFIDEKENRSGFILWEAIPTRTAKRLLEDVPRSVLCEIFSDVPPPSFPPTNTSA